jgi:hypothetical protein
MDELTIVAAHLVGAQVSHIPHATPRVVVDMYVDVLHELTLRRAEIVEAAEAGDSSRV